jgi:hypothetical protein
MDGDGTVIHHESLSNAATSVPGQELAASVPNSSKVYIIGNIPDGDLAEISNLGTFDEIKAATSAISTQDDYTRTALANEGEPVGLVLKAEATETDPAVYVAAVELLPLISRMELVSVVGGANDDGEEMVSFKVIGVYVDNFYPEFTYGGGHDGAEYTQGVSTDLDNGIIGDTADIEAIGNPLRVSHANGDVWAHNVAAGALPRFIVVLAPGAEWSYTDEHGDPQTKTEEEVRFVTLKSYKNVDAFQRGKIYRIGTPTNPFTITPDYLKPTPNNEDVDIIVSVDIVEWDVETPEVEM